MITPSELVIDDASQNFGKPNGLHWITAAFFLVGDMAGGGIVAYPKAMARSGNIGGIIIVLLSAITFCYTACVLSNNWIIMCNRWTVYSKHCRKPYPEMAYRAMGSKARLICSWIVNIVLFCIAVLFCSITAHIVNDFILSITGYNVGVCYMMIFAVAVIYPVTLLRSPQDFWWAVVSAMFTTLLAVILIVIGSWIDYGKPNSSTIINEKPSLNSLIASLGSFMFGFGGHVVFPSIQHDMKYPKKFIHSTIAAFTVISVLYLSVAIVGYAAYGNLLGDSVIHHIQTGWIRQCSDLFIGIHCLLTLTVVLNPINQEIENLVKAPHHFGLHRFIIRTSVILIVLFVAETVPKFGPILDIIGGTTVGLTSAALPLIYNNYLNASVYDPVSSTYKRPTLLQVFQRNSKSKLLIDFIIIVVSMSLGMATTYIAVFDLSSSNFVMPCYLSFLNIVSGNSTVEFGNQCLNTSISMQSGSC